MLTLKCLGSGSSGNCFILEYDGRRLLLDVGLPIKAIKQGLDYDLMSVKGVCVSHQHLDHSLAVKDLRKMGIQVFTPYESENPPKKTEMLPFSVQIFDLPHNVPNYGFYIKVADRKILYMTDFELCRYNFKPHGITDMIIEVNYQDKYLDMDAENINHKVLGHAELQTTLKFVEANITDSLKNVILTHLGVETCDGKECVSEIKKVVKEGVNVDYARPNETYVLKGEQK